MVSDLGAVEKKLLIHNILYSKDGSYGRSLGSMFS